jgi:hypothetical protein
MAVENGGSMVVADDSTDSFPCVRYRQSYYIIPKSKFVVKIKAPFKISYEQFLAMHNTKGNNASKSPKEWAPFISQKSFGIVEVNDGKYPVCMFDVDGHEEMRKFAHFVPPEVASKVFPELYRRCAEDPEAAGLKISSGSDETRERAQQRLDGLRWTPADCFAPGSEKCTLPNPHSCAWPLVAKGQRPKWCIEKAAGGGANTAAPKAGSGGKRKASELLAELPTGFKLTKQNADETNIEWAVKMPLAEGAEWRSMVAGNSLFVYLHAAEGKAQPEEGAEEAEEAVVEEEEATDE